MLLPAFDRDIANELYSNTGRKHYDAPDLGAGHSHSSDNPVRKVANEIEPHRTCVHLRFLRLLCFRLPSSPSPSPLPSGSPASASSSSSSSFLLPTLSLRFCFSLCSSSFSLLLSLASFLHSFLPSFMPSLLPCLLAFFLSFLACFLSFVPSFLRSSVCFVAFLMQASSAVRFNYTLHSSVYYLAS